MLNWIDKVGYSFALDGNELVVIEHHSLVISIFNEDDEEEDGSWGEREVHDLESAKDMAEKFLVEVRECIAKKRNN